ncbi:hypothetical protein FQA39_LY16720 [Lamprigera yunnana]|nr:hypothetical protein FQA39_LY16720 [Lamprigera yunnana]
MMWSIYEAESWLIATDAYSAVERMRSQFTALDFEADHETVYGLGRWHSEAHLQYLHHSKKGSAENNNEKDSQGDNKVVRHNSDLIRELGPANMVLASTTEEAYEAETHM